MEQKGKPTTVGGVPTGGITESGNTEHDPYTGEFGSKNGLDTTHMTEEEIKNHNIDKTVNVPHFDKNFKPFLQELLKKHYDKAEVYNVEELDKYSPGLTERLDKQGVDYVININGKNFSIDLKSIQPFENDRKAEIITLPVEQFDNKQYDKSKKRQGKHVDGWFARENLTNILAFQFLTNNQYQTSDAFLVSKEDLKEAIFNNYFSNYATNSEEMLDKIKSDFRLAKHKILTKQGDVTESGYDVEYDENDSSKVKSIRKVFPSKGYGHVVAKMSFEYKDKKINHSIVLLCPINKAKKSFNYISLDKDEKEKHDIGKLFGEVL